MKAYKGFNQDMTCRDFQYAEGETYELPDGVEAKLCKCGFHACEAPIDCFLYYNPAESIFYEVDLDATDEIQPETDSKRVGRRIKIGARLSVEDIISAQINFINEHINDHKGKYTSDILSINNSASNTSIEPHSASSTINDESTNLLIGYKSVHSSAGYGSVNTAMSYESINSATGEESINHTTGDKSINSATGTWSINDSTDIFCINSATGRNSANSAINNCSINSTTGIQSVNRTYGQQSINSTTGSFSANSALHKRSINNTTGDCSTNNTIDSHSINSSTGYSSYNIAIGNWSINSAANGISMNNAMGYGSVNVSTGCSCQNSGSAGTISVGWGAANMCKGEVGAYLVLCEREIDDNGTYKMIGEPVLIKIDGETYKADTYYMLKNGWVTECGNSPKTF